MTNNTTLSPEAVAYADRIRELLASMRSAEAELGALLGEVERRGLKELLGNRIAARLLEHRGGVYGCRTSGETRPFGETGAQP